MRFYSILILLLVCLSCANQGSLVGGEKDEIPPKVVGAYPESGSLNFSEKGFVIEFDENIQVKSLNQNLLISPFLEEKPEVKVRSRSIEVSFKEDLQENTTYTFNFGNAIQDLNESNKLSGFTYVFSTGNVLDKSILTGTALDASTGELPEKGAWAILHEVGIDSLFQTTAPRYATPIMDDGSFHFQNVKDGEYQLYALRDNNSNYFYDLPNEQVAFFEESVFINDSVYFTQPLSLFEQLPETGFVRKAVANQPQSIVLETSTDTERFSLQLIPDVQITNKSIYKDSIRFWFLQGEFPDSAFLSFDNQVVDTLKFTPFEGEIKDTILKLRLQGHQNYSPHQPIVLKSSRPFTRNENLPDPILLEDSLFVAGGVELIQDTLDANQYILSYDFDYEKEYIIQFDDSLFTDLYGLPSDSLGVQFTTPKLESLSVLNIGLSSERYTDSPLIFQLLKGSDVYITRYINSVDEKIILKDLPPSKYSVTIIIDENGNQKWDTGDYNKKRQPEQILVYESEIETRANWDVDVEINLDE